VGRERGVIHVRQQFTHGARSELKTENAPLNSLPAALTAMLKARYDPLNAGAIVLRPQEDDRPVFTSPEGGELDYSNWGIRRWNRLIGSSQCCVHDGPARGCVARGALQRLREASLLFGAGGSKTVAAVSEEDRNEGQVSDLMAPPAGVEHFALRP
jgi:hypothetical protein